VKNFIFIILTIFSAIAWLKFFSACLLDVILYYSYLFNINETFLSIVIISGGNSLGDLFANSALAELGNPELGLLSTFSGQIFNFFIGIGLNLVFGGKY